MIEVQPADRSPDVNNRSTVTSSPVTTTVYSLDVHGVVWRVGVVQAHVDGRHERGQVGRVGSSADVQQPLVRGVVRAGRGRRVLRRVTWAKQPHFTTYT